MVTLDNFGIFLAGHFTAPTSGKNVDIVDKSGVTQTVKIIGTSSNGVWGETNNGTIADYIQIGKGTTPATRQDFKLEDPFVTSPESSRFITISAGYNSGLGKITISAVLASTGGSGSITEVTKEQQMTKITPSQSLGQFLFFRDLISPVGFIIGQTVNVSYEVFI